LYDKLSDAVKQYGHSIRDVPKDGNCGLHAVIDQLHMRGITRYTVTSLRQKAVDIVRANGLPDGFLDKGEHKDFADYIQKQGTSGTWCDEPLLRSICTFIGKAITIIHDNGCQSVLRPQSDSSEIEDTDTPLVVGLMTDFHYVSLQPLSTSLITSTISHHIETTQELGQSKTSEVTNIE